MQKSDGSTLPTTRYTPFGNLRSGTAPPFTNRDFTGQRENREPGRLYYQARYYLPGIGRFASADTLVPDPANPQAYNRYTYSLNSPLRFVDPTGHRTCTAVQAATGDETCNQNIPLEQGVPHQSNVVPGTTKVTISVDFLHNWGVSEDYVTVPLHIDPYSENLFPWEVATNALYSEQNSLHPNQAFIRNHHPEWLPFLEEYWVGDSIGIVQTMVNSEGEFATVVQSGKYAYGVHGLDDPNYLQFLAIAYTVIRLDEIPDLVNGYAYFSHQDTDPNVRGQGVNLNDTCCTDRAAFGPNPYDLKTWHVFPPLEVNCTTTGY